MDATEIKPLTEEAVASLLADQETQIPDVQANGRRRAPRWPFPGTVEMWVPDETGTEQLALATCLNLSRHGLGMLNEEPLTIGLEFALAVHQPEASLHGRAIVRHCTETEAGYYVGVEFLFDKTAPG